MSDERPEGKSRAELLRLVAESNARYDRIGEVWNELTDEEQLELAERAELLAAEGADDG